MRSGWVLAGLLGLSSLYSGQVVADAGCGSCKPAAAGTSAADPARCAEYKACAIGTDLSQASGTLLDQYKKQRSEDGAVYKDRIAPPFALKDLEGRTVRLSDYSGRRVMLAFWQSHCSHSMKSLPTWNALARDLKSTKFEVVTVLFNGGDAKYVKSWYGPMGYRLPVLLAENETLAAAYGNNLVPCVFLVDERGRLVKKLVTQQSDDKLRHEVEAFARGKA